MKEQLDCIGVDNTAATFVVELKMEFDSVWRGRVTSVPPQTDGAAFEFTLTPIDDDALRLTMINHHSHTAYAAKGIPEVILPWAAARSGMAIQSSHNNGDAGMYRTAAATTMWRRIMQRGLASYDKVSDIFHIPPRASSGS